jgi:hypothetical protein
MRRNHFIKQGITTLRLKINRKIFLERLHFFLRTKVTSSEDRQYNENNDIVKITYTDNLKRDWGGAKPSITLEYDERNSFLLTVTIMYNRREARKSLVFTADELREKIMEELNKTEIWDIKGMDNTKEDLASDKRLRYEEGIFEEDIDAASKAHEVESSKKA